MSQDIQSSPHLDNSDMVLDSHGEATATSVEPQNDMSVRREPFVTSRAHKAARTRAWRTIQMFSAEQAEIMSLSNVFVRLPVSVGLLERAGVPIIKTKQEDRVALARVGRSREVLHCTDMTNLFERQDHPVNKDDAKEISSPFMFEKTQTKVVVGEKKVVEAIAGGHTAETFSTTSDRQQMGAGQCHRNAVQLSFKIQPSSAPTVHQAPHFGQSVGSGAALTEFDQNKAEEVPGSAKSGCTTAPNCLAFGHLTEQSTVLRFEQNSEQSLSTRSKTARPLVTTEYGRITGDNAVEPGSIIIEPRYQTRTRARTRAKPSYTSAVSGGLSNSDCSGHLHRSNNMAPVRDPNNVESSLKDAIQKLFEVQSQVHGFVPETQPLLVDKMTELAQSLSHLQTLTSSTLSPNNPIHNNRIAPEVIDYVDDSRNPDIYNREFVELVQRGNSVMKGKQQAFKDFGLIFAAKLKERMPELSSEVDKIMAHAKFDGNQAIDRESGDNGTNGANWTERAPTGRKDGDVSANGARNV